MVEVDQVGVALAPDKSIFEAVAVPAKIAPAVAVDQKIPPLLAVSEALVPPLARFSSPLEVMVAPEAVFSKPVLPPLIVKEVPTMLPESPDMVMEPPPPPPVAAMVMPPMVLVTVIPAPAVRVPIRMAAPEEAPINSWPFAVNIPVA